MSKIRIVLISIVLFCLPFSRSRAELAPLAYPDPTADIAWSAGYDTVTDIQAAFNNAHTQENAQLGTSIPLLTLPSQAEWDAMNDNQRAFWLMNHERTTRGLAPWTDTDPSLINVAQNYADYLMATSQFSHGADGHNPGWRMFQVPAIAACWQYWSENLATFMTSGYSIAMPVERSVYAWMYRDSGSAWGHRHGILKDNYDDNSGPAGSEGFIGIGRAHGPYRGWNFGEVVVMDSFDPCASWANPAPVFFIAGEVLEPSTSVPGWIVVPDVQITISGGTEPITGTTDSYGYYSLVVPGAGTYTVSPSKAGNDFIPGQRQVMITSANATEVDFTVGVPTDPANNTYLPAILKNH